MIRRVLSFHLPLFVRKVLFLFVALSLLGTPVALAVCGDLSGAGKSDILWHNSSTGQNAVWLMNGASILSGQYLTTISDLNWQIVGVGDFKGDGTADILWHNSSTGQNAVWLMNGSTILSGQYLTTISDLNWKIVGMGDFNGDGKADILWHNSSTGQNAVWLMNGASILSGQYLTTASDLNWQIAGVSDFNGDGKADILWHNSSTGQNAVWLMNGSTILSGQSLTTISDKNWHVVPTMMACVATKPKAQGISPPQEMLIAQQISYAVAQGLNGVSFAHAKGGPNSYAVRPESIACNQTGCFIYELISVAMSCQAGGSMQLTGTISGWINNAGTGLIQFQLHLTMTNCSFDPTLVLNGAPYISITGNFSFLNFALSSTQQFVIGGGFMWGTDPSQTCNLNLTTNFNANGNGNASGTVCGDPVYVTF